MRNLRHCGCWNPGLLLLVAVLVGLCVPGSAPAQKKSVKSQADLLKSGEPIQISSDRMELDQKSSTVTFEGHVVVVQGKLTITGKRLTIYAEQGAARSKEKIVEQIDRIEMQGDVRVSQEDKLATAGKAVFYNKEQKIVLSDQPQLMQGSDRVQGALITLYLEHEKSVIEGSDARPVQAVLHPKKGQ